ncbi:Fe-S cluster assembly protein SufD [Rhizobiaceae bacterium]|nr:Fe-S cluster assembly protein SufD [Rhizobiaceae bacterium]
MNAHTPRIHTEGEQALFDAHTAAFPGGDSVVKAALHKLADIVPGIAAPVPARHEALDVFRRHGLPTRKFEAFHYTDLRAALRGPYTVADRPADDVAKSAGAAFPRLVAGAAVLHFRDGHLFDMGETMPEGVTADHSLPDLVGIEPSLNDTVPLINQAFAREGATITVPANARIDRTIGLASTPTGVVNAIGATRVALDVGANACCHVVERSVGPDGLHYMVSSQVDLTIGDGAHVTYTLSIEDGDAAERLARLSVRLGTGSKLTLHVLNAGGALVRQELFFVVAGENAALEIAGVNLIGAKAHIDLTSRIDHIVPSTTSTELFRNVATEKGRGVFQGQIRVAQAAQLTDARMACNTLLLSEGCDFSAKPELEIFADDVQCAHGATVADIEKEHLFYLRARGITEDAARRLLTKAFVAEAFDGVENEQLAEALSDRIDRWMEAHV